MQTAGVTLLTMEEATRKEDNQEKKSGKSHEAQNIRLRTAFFLPLLIYSLQKKKEKKMLLIKKII